MKCFIIGPAFPLRGGIANFNEALCKAMTGEGIDCSIVSFSMQYPSFLFPGKSQLETGSAPEGLKIFPLINSINPYSWFRTAAFINSQKPDFVIIRFWLPFMAPALGTIARLINKNCRILAITDNVIPHEKRPGDFILTKYFIRSCHAFIAMSKSVLEDLSKFTDNKNKYFSPHPIYDIFGEKTEKSTAREYLGLEKNGKYLLFFGFIRKYKGLDMLLEAMTDPSIRDMGVKLVVAGEFYEDAKPYFDYIEKNNLKDTVILKTHFIPREEVKYFFCAADMIVQPYRDATQSGVTQVAYQFDRPMLVTNVGGLAEIVPDGKVGYVTELKASSIAKAIFDFYRNTREVSFSEMTALLKKNFSWNTFVGVILTAFRKKD